MSIHSKHHAVRQAKHTHPCQSQSCPLTTERVLLLQNVFSYYSNAPIPANDNDVFATDVLGREDLA